jgi:hypothetical protein
MLEANIAMAPTTGRTVTPSGMSTPAAMGSARTTCCG